jgi:hypothetical protein
VGCCDAEKYPARSSPYHYAAHDHHEHDRAKRGRLEIQVELTPESGVDPIGSKFDFWDQNRNDQRKQGGKEHAKTHVSK